jgi:hypothetical protein
MVVSADGDVKGAAGSWWRDRNLCVCGPTSVPTYRNGESREPSTEPTFRRPPIQHLVVY